jgi:hypothetical protein
MTNEQVRRRVANLESKGRACAECNARPTRIHVTYPEQVLAGDKDRPLPTTEYCLECGTEIPLALIRVEYEDQGP